MFWFNILEDTRPPRLRVSFEEIVDGRWYCTGEKLFNNQVEVSNFRLSIENYPTMSGPREAVVLNYTVDGEECGTVIEVLPKHEQQNIKIVFQNEKGTITTVNVWNSAYSWIVGRSDKQTKSIYSSLDFAIVNAMNLKGIGAIIEVTGEVKQK